METPRFAFRTGENGWIVRLEKKVVSRRQRRLSRESRDHRHDRRTSKRGDHASAKPDQLTEQLDQADGSRPSQRRKFVGKEQPAQGQINLPMARRLRTKVLMHGAPCSSFRDAAPGSGGRSAAASLLAAGLPARRRPRGDKVASLLFSGSDPNQSAWNRFASGDGFARSLTRLYSRPPRCKSAKSTINIAANATMPVVTP